MLLSRIHIDPRCKEARRDLSDPYQLHSTLCRAFSAPDRKCSEGEFLWRLEPETDLSGYPGILVQSRLVPDWKRIGIQGWLAKADPAINLREKLNLDSLEPGRRFRFRLRANPCVTRNGKRLGLLSLEEQESWLVRKGSRHGFRLPQLVDFVFSDPVSERVDVGVSQEQMLRGKQHSGNRVHLYSVLYDGVLIVSEPDSFIAALQSGIGHGKMMGLGLLSVAPIG